MFDSTTSTISTFGCGVSDGTGVYYKELLAWFKEKQNNRTRKIIRRYWCKIKIAIYNLWNKL